MRGKKAMRVNQQNETLEKHCRQSVYMLNEHECYFGSSCESPVRLDCRFGAVVKAQAEILTNHMNLAPIIKGESC